MIKIRNLITLSIDGFYVPPKLQKLFGFDALQYKSFCRDADAVLTNKSEYKKLREIELDCGIPVYVMQKGCSVLYENNDESRRVTIDELENKGKKNIVIIGNSRELSSVLLNKACTDEIGIYLFPLILGKGKRILSALSGYSRWKVKSRQLYDSGITVLHYIRE